MPSSGCSDKIGSTPDEQCHTPSSAPRNTKSSSAVRKEQNKIASRIYRERRKQKLALLDQLLVNETTNHTGTASTANQIPAPQQETIQTGPNLSSSAGRPGGVTLESTASPGTVIRSTGEQSAPSTFGDLSFDSPWPVPFNGVTWGFGIVRGAAAPSTMVSDLSPPRLASSPSFMFGHEAINPGSRAGGGSSQPWDPSTAMTLGQLSPFFSPQGQSPPASQDRSKARGITATDASKRQQEESLGCFLDHLMNLRVPDVKRVIYVQQNGLFAAIMDNTLAISVTERSLLFTDDATSPFNKDWLETKGSVQLSVIKSKFSAMPKDLQPVDSQITVEHHVYLDAIPFPSFRERALKALTCDPPLFDEDELCYDICNREGLVVWGSQGNDQGMDACRPWDMRSWEPKPWFLRKYHFLAGGWEDEMWKAARWWHTMRNEMIPK
ncbi:hypothetical protein VP1G_01481 [Cytospora mali]|uniref:BZIP domain-containing protein n=1 Tax=Cytospora mali TaxID=578113 RepID=A0A194UQZ1_CYTMA|nr:hypothetical protein VP1G_01481 [Valsa mali var. pyri (nom. inval.)]